MPFRMTAHKRAWSLRDWTSGRRLILPHVSVLTWTHCVAGAFLDRHALAEGAAVEGSRVCACTGTLLHAATTLDVTGGPVCPRRPASIDCKT